MKNKIFIVLFLSTLGLFTSCNEAEFLEEKPKDNLYVDNLYTTGDGFQLGVNAMLQFARAEREESESAEFGYFWKVGVDNGWSPRNLSWLRAATLYQSDWNPEISWIKGKGGVWERMYRTINTANTILERSENPAVDWGGTSAEEDLAIKSRIQSHAYLFRAWAYRHLALTFGAVPISTVEINGSNFKNDWKRQPVEEVRALIISDLKLAEVGLPSNSNSVLQVSKAVAQHYLAEMYLWDNNPEEAIVAAAKVLTNPNYALITERYGVRATQPGVPFMDQFYDGNILPSQGNKEALWVFSNTDIVGSTGISLNAMRRTWVVNYASSGYAAYSPEYGGRGLGSAAITAWGFSIYEANDDRYSKYAVQKEYVNQDTGIITPTQTSESAMKYSNNKWASSKKWYWTFEAPNLYGESFQYGHQTYLRLADTYLLMAEAQLKANGAGAALPYINAIRVRSNATPATAGEINLSYILDERSRELVTEEHRRETLVRTGTFLERIRAHNPQSAPSVNEYNQFLPIPQSEIDATGMDQNRWQ